MEKKGMIEGKMKYSRITYRPTEGDPCHSGTWKENLSIEKTVSLVTTYLRRIRCSPSYLKLFDNGQIWAELSKAYIYSLTASEMWLEKDPPFSEEEFLEFRELVQKEWNRRYGEN